MIAISLKTRFAVRTAVGFILSGLALTACSHTRKAPTLANPAYQSNAPTGAGILQEPRGRVIASIEEDPIEIVKDWVVTPDRRLGFITTLDEIEKHELLEGESADKPWSGSYWPDKMGGVAMHYRHINYGPSLRRDTLKNYKKWKKRHDRTVKNLDRLSELDIALLSPAEKYDLMMGDRDFTFTNRTWEGILQTHKTFGLVEGWAGVCDGWTTASVALNRPRRTVNVKSPLGFTIPLYPDDIKALASVLWSHHFMSYRDAAQKQVPGVQPPWTTILSDGTPAGVTYGTRCNLKDPTRSGGIVTAADECRDLNPAVWHLAIVNRTGAQKQSFIMDKDYDLNVNNHTVYGYRFTYFDVKSGKATKNYRKAIVPIDSLEGSILVDALAEARYVVGVDMKVNYIDYFRGNAMGETWDDEKLDKQDVMKVKYDLELDADYNPIGGQWRVNRKQKKRFILGYQKPSYPDFIWYKRLEVYSSAGQLNDPHLKQHDWSKPVPEVLRDRAKQGAQVTWLFSLRDRAGMAPTGTPEAVRAAARKASDEYDAACSRLCSVAYPRDENGNSYPFESKEWNTAEAIAAREEMEPVDKAFSEAAAKLDKLGVPKSKPYVQPLGRVVYGLFEAAKKADPTPPRRPDGPIEEEE